MKLMIGKVEHQAAWGSASYPVDDLVWGRVDEEVSHHIGKILEHPLSFVVSDQLQRLLRSRRVGDLR